jgi:hypothetical protein
MNLAKKTPQNQSTNKFIFNGMFSQEYSIEERSVECGDSSDPSVSNFAN